jgi:hypothetical protein
MKASVERICKNCEQPFTRIVRAAQTYCSAACRKSYWNKVTFASGRTSEKHNERPDKMMLRSAKHRAKKKGLPFNIDLSDIVIPKVCPVLGIELKANAGNGGVSRGSPSLDRIIPSLGYVKGNVQVISNATNLLKGDSTSDEMLLFAGWVIKTYSKEGTK